MREGEGNNESKIFKLHMRRNIEKGGFVFEQDKLRTRKSYTYITHKKKNHPPVKAHRKRVVGSVAHFK